MDDTRHGFMGVGSVLIPALQTLAFVEIIFSCVELNQPHFYFYLNQS